jgi:hypothetical protein
LRLGMAVVIASGPKGRVAISSLRHVSFANATRDPHAGLRPARSDDRGSHRDLTSTLAT